MNNLDFSTIAGLFLTIICLVWMLNWYKKKRPEFDASIARDPYSDTSLPQEMQSWGVMGTFLGITVGLIFLATGIFTGGSLDKSVNSMLTGMATAFLTSLCGMGSSFYLKREQIKKQRELIIDEQSIEGNSIADLISYLQKTEERRSNENKSLLEVMKNANEILADKISTSIQDVKKSVVGDGDYTVISQMKLIRSENRDVIEKLRGQIQNDNEKLIQEFRDFAKTMAENNAKSFIEALTATMNDFNTKLTEQFGENFKELNVAVGRLLEWQKQYMQTLDEVCNVQREIFAGIEGVRQSMANMAVSAQGITDSSAELSDIVLTAKTYNEQMKQLMSDLTVIGEQAQRTIPEVENFAHTVLEKISDTVKLAVSEMKLNKETAVGHIEEVASLAAEKNLEVHNKTEELAGNILKAIKENAEEAENTTIKSIENVSAAAMEKHTEDHNKIENLISDTFKTLSINTEAARDTAIRQIQTVFGNAIMTQESCQKAMQTDYENAMEQLKKLTKELQKNGKTMSDNSEEALNIMKNKADRLIRALEDVAHVINESASSVQRDMDANAKATHEAVQKAAASLREESFKVTKSVADEMSKMMTTNNESLQKSSQNLSKQLESSLNDSLDSFGKVMGALSQKFAQDYGPLTDRLREVVQLAGRIEKQRNRS